MGEHEQARTLSQDIAVYASPSATNYPTSTNRQAHEVSGLFWRKIIVDSAWTAMIGHSSAALRRPVGSRRRIARRGHRWRDRLLGTGPVLRQRRLRRRCYWWRPSASGDCAHADDPLAELVVIGDAVGVGKRRVSWWSRRPSQVPPTGRPSTIFGAVQPFGMRSTIIGQAGRRRVARAHRAASWISAMSSSTVSSVAASCWCTDARSLLPRNGPCSRSRA